LHDAGGRSRADWLVGINASQALTAASGSGVFSLGRVQTPTLALICKRFRNQSFKVEHYWQIELSITKNTLILKVFLHLNGMKVKAEYVLKTHKHGRASVIAEIKKKQ
jgi:DNA topoisomerase-3